MSFNPMNKMVIVLSIILFAFTAGNATSASKRTAYHERVRNLNTVIDIKMTDLVEEQIDLILYKKKKDSQYILGRTSLYFPKIENALREKGLPDELKYIAVIESSLMPDAVSWQGATGLWQFMKGTAVLYGMEVSKYIDERKDVDISTEKALVYLSTLYNIYGNWTTALAAYNCGPGNINKAIRKANGSSNYWDFAKYLPKETRQYIPKFIAASYLMNYYYLHDITPIEPANEIKFVGAVKVFDKMTFNTLRERLGVDYEVLQMLNPIYIKDIIPASKTGKYLLVLPENALALYLEKTQQFDHLVYLYSSDNNASTVLNQSSLRGVEASLREEGIVMLQNKLTKVFSNKLTIPTYTNSSKLTKNEKPTHLFKRKESLASLAEKNNIPLDELLSINGISEQEDIALNTVISIQK
ncbi:MAG: transglycosylase SLT domain-containing protein [Saprospiraceae bacterium]